MALAWSATRVMEVQEILDMHDRRANLEEGASQRVQVWHLLASLQEYCNSQGISLDDTLADVRGEQSGWRYERIRA